MLLEGDLTVRKFALSALFTWSLHALEVRLFRKVRISVIVGLLALGVV